MRRAWNNTTIPCPIEKVWGIIMYKVSIYNHFQPWDDGNYIAYNAFSGAVAMVTAENYKVLDGIFDKLSVSENPDFDDAERPLLQQLLYAGFVCRDTSDQTGEAAFNHYRVRYDSANCGYVIAPTMACNMACTYCFESNKTGRMSEEIIKALLDRIEKNLAGTRSLTTCWYGGEPLLAMDIMEKITKAIFLMKEKAGFRYMSSIITNGYLLTPENVDRLLEMKIKTAQVTLDGPARLHNKKRPLKNGKPSYDRILENVKNASGRINVSIRVNIDKDFDVKMLDEMLIDLETGGLRDKARIYFGFLEPATSVCANISENCHSAEDFSRAEIEHFRLMLERGFSIDKLPQPITNYCLAQTISGIVMDNEGALYKCLNHIGDKSKSMGHIRDGLDFQHPNFTRLFRFDPFHDDDCRECNILPICLGGCPSRRAERGLGSGKICETWKHNLPEMLEIIALSRYRRIEPEIKEKT
ncbi:MAG: radical SAM protein [Candidatus Zixiibacteriota bacterium]